MAPQGAALAWAPVQRLRRVVGRVRREGITPAEYRRITVVALGLLCIIVVSGAAVRLTGSGLGCTDWPRCNDSELVDVGTKHAAIEQVNRLFTGLVAVAVIVAVLGALIRNPRRRDLTWLSVGLVAGVIGQIVLGGITVLVDLHPVAVQSHFLLSMILVANAVVLLIRAGQPDAGRRVASVVPRTRRAVRWVVIWTGLALVAGTVVTGTGPHAGDEEARRFDLAITTVTRVHSIVAWLAVGGDGLPHLAPAPACRTTARCSTPRSTRGASPPSPRARSATCSTGAGCRPGSSPSTSPGRRRCGARPCGWRAAPTACRRSAHQLVGHHRDRVTSARPGRD